MIGRSFTFVLFCHVASVLLLWSAIEQELSVPQTFLLCPIPFGLGVLGCLDTVLVFSVLFIDVARHAELVIAVEAFLLVSVARVVSLVLPWSKVVLYL